LDMTDNLYWGDIHSHAYCGRAFSDPQSDLAIARSHLDFWSPTEHSDGQKFNGEMFADYWPKLRELLHDAYSPGEFVTILGWEWADDIDWNAGDMNVYFPGDAPENMPVPRTYPEMIDFVRAHNAILIPHHIGYMSPYPGTDWDRFVPDIMPAVEIFSMHGSSEREGGPFPMNLVINGPRASGATMVEGLERGLKFGIIASTDEHIGYPGAYGNGLMAAYAPELTRAAIWEALVNRRTYAVTGDRIKLEFSLEGAMMGSELSRVDRREIGVRVVGEDMLNEVDIVKNGRLWRRETCGLRENVLTDRARVRIEWGWGRGEVYCWQGNVEVSQGHILDVTPHFGPPGPDAVIHWDQNHCRWESHTFGNLSLNTFFEYQMYANTGGNLTNQLVLEIEGGPDTELHLGMGEKGWKLSLAELLHGSRVLVQESQEGRSYNPLGAHKIKVHQAVASHRYIFEGRFVDDEPQRETDYYYLRVTQANGQMAWSSPIWVSR